MDGVEGVSHVVLQIYLFFANPFWLGEVFFLILNRNCNRLDEANVIYEDLNELEDI